MSPSASDCIQASTSKYGRYNTNLNSNRSEGGGREEMAGRRGKGGLRVLVGFTLLGTLAGILFLIKLQACIVGLQSQSALSLRCLRGEARGIATQSMF